MRAPKPIRVWVGFREGKPVLYRELLSDGLYVPGYLRRAPALEESEDVRPMLLVPAPQKRRAPARGKR